MDILVPMTMKNAAKCDTQCELQNSLNHSAWFTLHEYVCFSIQNITNHNMIDKTYFGRRRLSSSQNKFLFLPNEAVTFTCDLIVNEIMSLQITKFLPFVSEIKQDYPLNLSISLSGGKENNSDYLSSGERTGISPILNPSGIVI